MRRGRFVAIARQPVQDNLLAQDERLRTPDMLLSLRLILQRAHR
jgi:hypothetical protein